MKLCDVCKEAESKYKCPTCRVPYCSAACCKKHKLTPCISTGDQLSTTLVSNEIKHKENEETEDIPKMNILQLQKLKQSEKIKRQLLNPELRALLTKVYNSENAKTELDRAMLDPSFAKFMYDALDKVE